jgi:hypothetical protein
MATSTEARTARARSIPAAILSACRAAYSLTAWSTISAWVGNSASAHVLNGLESRGRWVPPFPMEHASTRPEPGACAYGNGRKPRVCREKNTQQTLGLWLVQSKFWWRQRDLNLRPRAYESLLAGSPPFATIRFSPSGRRKSGNADSRGLERTGAVVGRWMLSGCSFVTRAMQLAEDDDGELWSPLLVAGTLDSRAACPSSFALSVEYVGVAVT